MFGLGKRGSAETRPAASPREIGVVREIRVVTMGYEGNSFREYRSSVIASHKKILFETPCPGRNLPEDTYCFDLSIVTGLGQL